MVQSTLDEVRTMEIDEGGRGRLSEVDDRTVSELRGLLSEDLQDELDDIALTPPGTRHRPVSGGPPGPARRSAPEGPFQGIQASMASR